MNARNVRPTADRVYYAHDVARGGWVERRVPGGVTGPSPAEAEMIANLTESFVVGAYKLGAEIGHELVKVGKTTCSQGAEAGKQTYQSLSGLVSWLGWVMFPNS